MGVPPSRWGHPPWLTLWVLTPKLMGTCSSCCHHDEDYPSPVSTPLGLHPHWGAMKGGVSRPRGPPSPAWGHAQGADGGRKRGGDAGGGGGKHSRRSDGSIVGTACARGWGGSGATHRCHPTELSPHPGGSVSQSDTHPRVGMVRRDGGQSAPMDMGSGSAILWSPRHRQHPSAGVSIPVPFSVWVPHPGTPSWGVMVLC